MTVAYADSPEKSAKAALVHEWQRGDIPQMIMSASSGPKDYVKNMIFLAFESRPEIAAVRMLILNGKPFCLFRVGENWHDCTGKQVVVSGEDK